MNTQDNIGYVAYSDVEYPPLLKHIKDPPTGLFYKGNIHNIHFDAPCIAIVGTRKPSNYGLKYAHNISYELAKQGAVIVSGMAAGIDAAAHRGALAAGGKTIAVLGGGLDDIYPSENRGLYEEIIKKGGLVVSEMPLGTKVERWHFVVRNRIVAGMSKGVFVVEGARRSGSLITARLALSEGREVWTLPGQVGNIGSEAPLLLLKEGAAYLVTSASDILSSLHIKSVNGQQEQAATFNDVEEKILNVLKKEEMSIDDLFMQVKVSLLVLQQTLLALEMRGVIKKTISGVWAVQ